MNLRNTTIFSTVLLFLFSTAVSAQERTIAVDANANVSFKADQLKFTVTLTKYGESIKKAKAAFDEQKKSFNTSFNVMKFKGLSKKTTNKTIATQPSIPGGGMGMAPAIGFGGGGFGGGAVPAAPGEAQFYVSETIEFTVDGIDKWSEQDVEKEVMTYVTELKKLSLMPTSGFSTALSSQGQAKKKAFAKAMEKARENAAALAELAGGKVGKVLNVEQAANAPGFGNNPYAFGWPANTVNYGVGGISPTISTTANLRVTFQLVD